MPKHRFPKLEGRVYNISIDLVDFPNTLPSSADTNTFLIVKANHNLSYHDYVYFEAV